MIILTAIIIAVASFGKYVDGRIHASATTILEDRLKGTTSIKWADYNNADYNNANSCTRKDSEGRCLIGKNILKEAYDSGIELILRGHSDQGANTKILLKEGVSTLTNPGNLEYFKSIQEIEPYGITKFEIDHENFFL